MAINWNEIGKQSEKLRSSLKQYDTRTASHAPAAPAPVALPTAVPLPSVSTPTADRAKTALIAGTTLLGTEVKRAPVETVAPAVSRDAGARQSYAARSPETTGGTLGALTRRSNTALVEAARANTLLEQAQARKMSIEMGLSTLHGTGSQAAANQAQADYSAAEQARNTALQNAYTARNELALHRIGGDAKLRADFNAARTLRDDLEKITLVQSGGQGPQLDSGEAGAAYRYLNWKYGVDTFGLRELQTRLLRELEAAEEGLKGQGIDLEDVTGYEQMRKDREAYQKEQEALAAQVRSGKGEAVAGSVLSVLKSPIQGLDYLRTMGNSIGKNDPTKPESYVPMNVYNMGATNFVSTVRGTVSQELEKNTDWELFGQNVASFLYNTGMSIADSAVQTAVFGGGGSLLMGMGAASSQSKNVIERGGTNEQAFWGGLAAGAAEAVFEKVSIDNLLKPRTVDSMKDLLRETVKQAGVEASEEMLTEVSNILTDAAIMGGQSEFQTAVARYRAQGMGAEEAKRRAYLDCVGQVALSGAAGALSGGVMGGTVSTANYAAQEAGSAPEATQPAPARNAVPGAATGLTGGTAAMPGAPIAQNNTASTGEAGEYRAVKPQNVDMPTVPIINLSMQTVAGMNGGVLPSTGNTLRKDAITRARTRLGLDENSAVYIPASNVTRNGDEYVLKVTKSSLNKMLSPSDGDRIPSESIVILDNLERIANNGVYFKSEGDRQGRDQIAGYDHLMTTVYIDGQPYSVDMRVRVYDARSGGENRLYYFTPEEIITVEKIDAAPPTGTLRERAMIQEAAPILKEVGTNPPTGERRAFTISSEGVPTSSAPIIADSSAGGNTYSAQNSGAAVGPESVGAATTVQGGITAMPGAPTAQNDTASMQEAGVIVIPGASAINKRNQENNTLAYTLATNIKNIQGMGPVTRLTGREMNNREQKPSEQIAAFFKSLGGKVFRKGLGDVSLGEYGVGGMLNHRPLNRAKMVSLAAVPDVIQSGQQIGYDPNWKGRGYSSYIFAAPVKIGDHDVFVAAVVDQRPDNKFYLSEMVDSDGNYVRIEESPSSNSKYGVTDGAVTGEDGVTARPEGLSKEANLSAPNKGAAPTLPLSAPIIADSAAGGNPYSAQNSGAAVGPESVGAAKAGFDPWSEFQGSRDRFHPEGANAARSVDVPTTDPEGRPISKAASTVMGARAIPDEVVGDIENLVLAGKLSYDKVSDKAATSRAVGSIQERGFERSMEDFAQKVRQGVVNKDVMTLGQQLLVNAANAGDGKAVAEILTLYRMVNTHAGQAVQAASILRKLDPSAQLYGVSSMVYNLNETLRKRHKDIDIRVDQALLDEFTRQTDQAGRDAVMDKIYQNVADQIPATWKDKWDAWRYLSMLFNPRTHVRNVAGNALFQPVRMLKNEVAAAIEAGVSKASGGKLERTKSFASSPAMFRAAWGDFANVKDTLSGNKYDDIRSEINDRRTIFKTLPLEKARKGNSWLLEAEDAIFKRVTYADSLAGYLTAHGVTASELRALNDETQKNASTGEAGNSGIVPFSAQEAQNLTSRKGVVNGQGMTFRQFIDNVKGLGNAVRFYFGKASDSLGQEIENAIGRNVTGYNIAIRSDEVAHAMARHGNAAAEAKRGQLPVTPEALERLPEVFNHPDEVVALSSKDYAGRTAFEVRKQLDGYMVAVVGVADGRHSIEVDSVYIINKKGSPTTANAAQNAPLGPTSKTSSGQTLSDAPIIAGLPTKGNTQSAQNSGKLTAELLSKARDYAAREALRATYQDRNAVSDKVTQLAGVLGPVGDAVLPFRRTPANILVRGLEYSPAGLAKALTYDLAQVKKGNKSGAEAIDGIAAGLTGSALLGLGAYLAALGLVTPGGGDDEKQDAINDLTGGQNYALNLPGGTSVTLDWLAPAALPFFMGVELMEGVGEGGFTAESAYTALKSISEPMLELSMLQSLNDMIESVSFSENKTGALIYSALVSYLTQGIPTVGGQIERTSEDRRMSTYTDKNSRLPGDLQYALGRASARIPGLDYQQVPYVDAWGREEATGTLPTRAFNNFANPAYTSHTNVTPVDAEVQRLYTATGDGSVVPSRPGKSITVDGETVHLSGEQYTQYATLRGKAQFSMLDELINSGDYQALPDSEKAGVFADVYDYADAAGKAAVSDYTPDGWIAQAQTAERELGVSPGEYILLYEKYGGALTGGDAVREAYRAGIPAEEYLDFAAGLSRYNGDGEGSLTLQEQARAIQNSGLSQGKQEKLWLLYQPEWKDEAREAGVSQGVYIDFKVSTSGLSGDKDPSGKTISGSKKTKVLAAIDALDASKEEKDALYYAAGYSASTLQDAPWY